MNRPNAKQQPTQGVCVERRTSPFEEKYPQFTDAMMRAADQMHSRASPFMHDLNQVFSLVNGLAEVMRIISNNVVIQDCYVPEDAACTVPMSQGAISDLAAMSAAVRKMIARDIASRAEAHSEKEDSV